MPTATHNTAKTTHRLALMKQGDDAFNARNRAGMSAVHHPDLVAHLTGSAEPLRGQAAHAAAMERMMRAFPDVHVDNDPYPVAFGSGDWTTVVTRATGTFSGEMTLPEGTTIAPTGQAFDLDFCTVARWDGDVMAEEFVFWDSALQAQQLGLAG